MDIQEKIVEAKKVFDTEISALTKMRDSIDETFSFILDEIVNCKGKVIITGMGKPGHIAGKIAATMSSLGTPAFHLDPAEAMHGDLGMIDKNDIVIAISYSGESDEIIRILPNIKILGAKLIGISANKNSTLVKYSDIAQVLPDFEEACYLGLAPTSSTTVELCYGDALSVVASKIYGYKDTDFGMRHPAGALGKKLILKVGDLMAKNAKNAISPIHSTLKEIIVELSRKGLGIVNIVNPENKLLGVITDGDLRRQLEKGADIYSLKVENIMTKHPTIISSDRMAIEALNLMKNKNISCLPVVDNNQLKGTIRLQDIISRGIVG